MNLAVNPAMKLALLFTRAPHIARPATIDGEAVATHVALPVVVDPESHAFLARDWDAKTRPHQEPWAMTQTTFDEQMDLYRILGFEIWNDLVVSGDIFVITPLDAVTGE